MAEHERNVSVSGSVVNSTIITGDVLLPAEPVRTLFQLRAPTGDFVGREQEIAMLCNVLMAGTSVTISAINGMGGR